jgi:hypothetical protein
MTSFRASLLAKIVSAEALKADTFPKSTFNNVVMDFTIEKDNRKKTSSAD